MKWTKAKLSDVCIIEVGKTPSRKKPEYFGNGFTWLSIGDMNGNLYIDKSKEQITEKAVADTKIKMVPANTVLYSFKLSIGKVNISKTPLYTNEAIAALIIKDRTELDTKFLYYAMICTDFSHLGEKAVKGITLNKDKLNKLSLNIPDIKTQKRIVSILDKANTLRNADRQLVSKYDELLLSIYLQLFGEKAVKKHKWELVKLESLAKDKKGSIRSGPFGSDLLHSEFVNNGVVVLGIDNAVNNKFEWGVKRYITHEKYKLLERYTIYPEDIIITIMGTTGKSAVIPKDIPLAINSKHLAAITLNKDIANPYFISYSIYSNPFLYFQLKSINRGAIMEGLNLSLIKDLKMHLPPISLQNQFADVASNILRQKELAQLQRQQSEILFQSLLQRAFKGEL